MGGTIGTSITGLVVYALTHMWTIGMYSIVVYYVVVRHSTFDIKLYLTAVSFYLLP